MLEEEKTPVENTISEEENSSVEPEVKEEVKPAEETPVEELDPFEKEVEDKRIAFVARFKKNRLISRVMMGVVLAAVIGAILLITLKNTAATIAGYSLAGATLVGLLVYFIIAKRKAPNLSQDYIREVSDIFNQYVFDEPDFTDLKMDHERKITAEELDLDRAYKHSPELGNRNFVSASYKGHPFEAVDLAIYKIEGEGKKAMRKVAFLGKYLTFKNEYKFDGRYIFNLRNSDKDKAVDQPNDIEDLVLVRSDGNLDVYGPNDKEFGAIFKKDFINKFKSIDLSNPLLNVVMVVWGGHTGLYLSYDDPVTTVPFQKQFKKDPQERYRKDLHEILDFLMK